jgi:anti-sigma-K factor RskA
MTTPESSADSTPDMTAAELALGVLDGEERAAALRRMLADPVFAAEVARWRRHLSALFADWPEAEPAEGSEAQVMAAIDRRSSGARGWRWATAVSSLAAAGLLVALVQRPVRLVPAPAPAPVAAPAPLVAVFQPDGAKPFGAVYDRAAHEVRIAGGLAVPRGRDAELWAIPADGKPRALGLLARDGAGRVRVTNVPVGEGVTLAISIEPLGGSPKSTPTGPVVATGALTLI